MPGWTSVNCCPFISIPQNNSWFLTGLFSFLGASLFLSSVICNYYPPLHYPFSLKLPGICKTDWFPHAPYSNAWVRENHDWLAWANNNIMFNLDIITCTQKKKKSRRNSRAPLFPSFSISVVQWWSVSFRNPNQERCSGATFTTSTKMKNEQESEGQMGRQQRWTPWNYNNKQSAVTYM